VLVFKNNTFVFQRRDPDCKLPSDFCNQPLSSPERYSIQVLFEQAQRCTYTTKAAYMALRPFSLGDFHGFETFQELLTFAQSEGMLVGNPVLCIVEYDPIYGYPRDITSYIPNAFDNVGSVQITKLMFLSLQTF